MLLRNKLSSSTKSFSVDGFICKRCQTISVSLLVYKQIILIRYFHKTIVFDKLKLRCNINLIYIFKFILENSISISNLFSYQQLLTILKGMAEPRCHLIYCQVLLNLAPKFISNVLTSLCLRCHHPCPHHLQVSHLHFCSRLLSLSSPGCLQLLLNTARRSSY